MKKTMAMALMVLLGLGLATPVLADHGGYYGGHRYVRRGGFHAGFFAPRPRFHTSISFGFGVPFFGYAAYAPPPPYYYYDGPPPVAYGPGYCRPYWVPGHYVYGGGPAVWVEGYWAR